jgi:hypothetical protein
VEYPHEICEAKMSTKNKLIEISSGCVVGNVHLPSCMLLLYRGLIGSVLEYGSVCYTGMAGTHMLSLERVQYRALRISKQSKGFEWDSTATTQIVLS